MTINQTLKQVQEQLALILKEIKSLKKFNLKKIKRDLDYAINERDNLRELNSKIRTKEQNKRLEYLDKLIVKANLKLRIDSIKTGPKEANPFPVKIVRRRKTTVNGLEEIVPIMKDGKPVYETIKKRLYKTPKFYFDEKGNKTWMIPKDYARRVATQCKINARKADIKKAKNNMHMFEAKIKKSKIIVFK